MTLDEQFTITVESLFLVLPKKDGKEVHDHVKDMLDAFSTGIAARGEEKPSSQAEVIGIEPDEKMTFTMTRVDWTILNNLAQLGFRSITDYAATGGAL